MPDRPDDDPRQWQHMVDGLRRGDDAAAREFWSRYGPLMRAVADQHLSPGLRRRVEPEDVVQSVCRTFFRRAAAGEFQLADSQALWRLLCAITVTKVREQARFHGRAKRGVKREVPLDRPVTNTGDSDAGSSHFAPASKHASPAEAAAFADQFRSIIEALDEEERQVVCLKLDDFTNDQVAEKIGCSERTVRRLMKEVQGKLAKVLDAQKA